MSVVTRLAPTPSGALHVGNAYSFLLAWVCARVAGGQVILRVEDVDAARARPEWIEAMFRDLEWLGLDWDRGPSGPDDLASVLRQSSSERQERYREVFRNWVETGLLYPCCCTRSQLRSDAPQVERLGEGVPAGPLYGGNCRGRSVGEANDRDSWRLRLPTTASLIEDRWQGMREIGSLADLGDPVLRRGDGVFAYHLAVCVDDADQEVNLVVRGRDLLPFAHLHSHLHKLLESEPPRFAHHGLLGDGQGRRLAKRIGSGSLASLRQQGRDPRELLGMLSRLIHPAKAQENASMSACEIVQLGEPTPCPHDLPCPSLPGETP